MINKNSFQDTDYYFIVHSFMIRELGLRDTRLLIYAVIYNFSKSYGKTFYGTLDFLSECIGKGKTATWEAVKRLIDDGFILVGKGEKFEHKEYVVNPEKLKFLSLRSKIKALDECIANSKLSKIDSEPPKSCDMVSEIDSEPPKSCDMVSEIDSEPPKSCNMVSKIDSESFNSSQQGTQDGQNSHTRRLNSHTEVSETECEGIGIRLPGYRNLSCEVSETDSNNKHNNKHNNKLIFNYNKSADAQIEERKKGLKRVFDFSNNAADNLGSYLSSVAEPEKICVESDKRIEDTYKASAPVTEGDTLNKPRSASAFKLGAASTEEFDEELLRIDKFIEEMKMKYGEILSSC